MIRVLAFFPFIVNFSFQCINLMLLIIVIRIQIMKLPPLMMVTIQVVDRTLKGFPNQEWRFLTIIL